MGPTAPLTVAYRQIFSALAQNDNMQASTKYEVSSRPYHHSHFCELLGVFRLWGIVM